MNLKKLIVGTLLLSLSSAALADIRPIQDPRRPGREDRNPIPPSPNDPWDNRDPWDSRDPWESDREEREVRKEELQVRQYFQGQSRLDLLADSYTRMRLQGAQIRRVVIHASSEMGNGQARLLANGQVTVEGAQTLPRAMDKHAFKLDPFANTMGRSLRTLDLEMRGRIYVEKVVFHVSEAQFPPGPGPVDPGRPQVEVVRQQLNETIQGEGGQNLFRLFNLAAERQGQSLLRVTVLARAQWGSATAELHLNSQSAGAAQYIGSTSTRLSFETYGQRIGQQIQALRLQVRGNVVIEEISLEIENRSVPGPGPGFPQERRLEQVINQRLYDTSGVLLSDLMRLERRHEERIVESVELVLRNADMASKVKLCQIVAGQFQAVNCGAPTTLSSGSQIVRLQSVNYAKLREVSLSVRMGMIDIDRIIINLR